MKIVVRRGVFETNSSSTHTLALVTKENYEADNELKKPKYRKFNVIATKRDKLLMACGCCVELFDTYDFLEKDVDSAYVGSLTTPCEIAVDQFVRIYCELTGEDYKSTYASIDAKNKSGRACHMNFFSEGALYDAEYDYELIDRLLDGNNVENKIREYFDDSNLLCYREIYGGLGWADIDDDDE